MEERSAHALAPGVVVYDHLAHRMGRIEQVRDDGSAVAADARGVLRWEIAGFYALALERLDAPSELLLAFQQPTPALRRESLLELGSVERTLALCRGVRTGPFRTSGERIGDRLLSTPVSARELQRTHEAAMGKGRADDYDEVVEALRTDPRGEDGPLRVAGAGLRVVLDEPSWFLERLVLDRTRSLQDSRRRSAGLDIGSLVRDDASSRAPYDAEEEAVLAWALGEVLRIERGERLEPVDSQRGGELRARLWAVFRSSVAARTTRSRGDDEAWIDPETVPEEAFESLLAHLQTDPDPPASIARLRKRLAMRGPSNEPTSQLIRCALYDCLEALRRRGALSTPRHVMLDTTLHEPAFLRPVDSVETVPLDRDIGFGELRGWLADTTPGEGADARQERARRLLDAIRQVFARGLDRLRDRDPVAYRTVLLDFMSLLSRPQIAACTGINYNTFRWWFPRAGDRMTRPPRFIRALLPPELATFVERFGRVFPILQLGLLPRQGEIDALAQDETVRLALGELFVHTPLDERGEFWGEGALRRAAQQTGRTVEAFVDDVLLPFLASLVEHRRTRSLERGGHSVGGAIADQEVEAASLAILVLGAPDGRALGRWVHDLAPGEQDRRRRFARQLGLEPVDLTDLELGRRWARPEEVTAMTQALGEGAASALAGLRPDPLTSRLLAALHHPEEIGP